MIECKALVSEEHCDEPLGKMYFTKDISVTLQVLNTKLPVMGERQSG